MSAWVTEAWRRTGGAELLYATMTDDDLKSVFAFLQTVKPVKHQLDNTEPPTYCRLCKQKHGFGRTN